MSSAFSNFFRDLPETLQQPAALAMLGSLGAHLILFATLPAFTSSPDPAQAEIRRVRLLEPPQGSNSPQASTSRLGLPPVPNTPNSKIQLPQAGQATSPVPNPLYTIPDFTPVPIPAPPQQPQLRTSQDTFSELLKRLANRPQSPIRIPKPPQEKPPAPPPQNQSPTMSPSLPPANPRDAITTPFPPGTPNQPAQTQTPTPSPSASPNRMDQLLAATRYNPQGTTQQESLVAQQSFTQALKDKSIDWERIVLRKPQDPIPEVPFPAGLVLQGYENRQHSVAIAVLVDKNGKPLPDTQPEILASSGYGILNQKAKEIVQANAAPEKLVPLIQAYEAQKTDPTTRNKAQAYLLVYEFKFKAPSSSTASTPQQRN